jgi:hypothetical protein
MVAASEKAGPQDPASLLTAGNARPTFYAVFRFGFFVFRKNLLPS